MKLYGLKNCDTCRKALKILIKDGHSAELVDIRAKPLSVECFGRFLAQFGDALVNKQSTTWRGLNDSERAGDPAELLTLHPALMKRPVIESSAGLTLGWNEGVRSHHLGS